MIGIDNGELKRSRQWENRGTKNGFFFALSRLQDKENNPSPNEEPISGCSHSAPMSL